MRLLACVLAFGAIASPQRTPPAAAAPAPPLHFPTLPLVSPLGARNDLPNPYKPGVSWGQLPNGRRWGSTAGITIGRDGNIWAVDRCGVSGAQGTNCLGSPLDPILEFDPSGKLLKSFGAGLFVSPHKISIDPEGFIWVADNGVGGGKGQQVFKFDENGNVLMTLGKAGVKGNGVGDDVSFDEPTDVAVAKNGDIFVADGHGREASDNARIVKFDKTGKFLKTWGKKGRASGEFDGPHTLAFDSRGRLYVGDRQNNRIQVFNQDGTFIAEWKQFGRPSGIYIDPNDVMYVADSESRDGATGYGYDPGTKRGIRIGDARNGNVYAFIPDTTEYPYPVSDSNNSTSAEGITADALGNVYGAEFTMDVKKYVRK